MVACVREATEIARRDARGPGLRTRGEQRGGFGPKARRLLDEIASPHLKVTIDPANMFPAGELPRMREILDEAFALVGKDIVLAHAKDLDHDGDAGHLAAGQGKLDYDRYLSVLRTHAVPRAAVAPWAKRREVPGCVAFLRQKRGTCGVSVAGGAWTVGTLGSRGDATRSRRDGRSGHRTSSPSRPPASRRRCASATSSKEIRSATLRGRMAPVANRPKSRSESSRNQAGWRFAPASHSSKTCACHHATSSIGTADTGLPATARCRAGAAAVARLPCSHRRRASRRAERARASGHSRPCRRRRRRRRTRPAGRA